MDTRNMSELSLEELLALADKEIAERDEKDEEILGNEERSRDAALEESTDTYLLSKILDRYKDSENESAIRRVILNNTSVDIEVLRKFASSTDCDKLQIASNPATPSEILEIIVNNTEKISDIGGKDLSEIFNAVINHQNVTESLKAEAEIKLGLIK